MEKNQVLMCCMVVCLIGYTVHASYTYEIYAYDENSKILSNSESILFDLQGGMDMVDLRDESSANVLGTSNLAEGSGGIWQIELGYASSLSMSGGQVNLIDLGGDATAFLSGGLIQQIWSGQYAWKWDYDVDPPAQVPNPHITIECSDHFYNTTTKILTGHWLDSGTAFSIQLIDVGNYSPAIDNIQFVPEPASLLLLGLGGLMLRRKK